MVFETIKYTKIFKSSTITDLKRITLTHSPHRSSLDTNKTQITKKIKTTTSTNIRTHEIHQKPTNKQNFNPNIKAPTSKQKNSSIELWPHHAKTALKPLPHKPHNAPRPSRSAACFRVGARARRKISQHKTREARRGATRNRQSWWQRGPSRTFVAAPHGKPDFRLRRFSIISPGRRPGELSPKLAAGSRDPLSNGHITCRALAPCVRATLPPHSYRPFRRKAWVDSNSSVSSLNVSLFDIECVRSVHVTSFDSLLDKLLPTSIRRCIYSWYLLWTCLFFIWMRIVGICDLFY